MNERTSCVYPIRVIRREALPATVALGKSKFGAMAMGKIKLLLGASILLLVSVQVNASPVTVGSLSSDDDGSTQIITDTYNNFEWLRWDVLADLNYTQTLAAIGSSGLIKDGTLLGMRKHNCLSMHWSAQVMHVTYLLLTKFLVQILQLPYMSLVH